MWISAPGLFFQTAFVLLLWIFPADGKLARPKLYGRAIAHRDLDTRYANTKKKIVLIHNFYRARVNPPASNMLEMRWHRGAQEAAQRWAGACQYMTHDKPIMRWVNDLGSCGQNIFVSSVEVDWMYVAKAWFMEHLNFTYGGIHNKLHEIGHYTQMVWYNSHKIGCGFRYCGANVVARPFFNYVCNYCPIGNYPKTLSRPYAVGKPCEKCQNHCKYKRLCTNSCPFADKWLNCGDLGRTFRNWLCTDASHEGPKACMATCQCPHAIG